MKYPKLQYEVASEASLCFIVLLLLLLQLANCSKQNVAVLLGVKRGQLDDPAGLLHDWVDSGPNAPCSWTGITCNDVTNNVVSIDLPSFGLNGYFPADFCRILTLRNLDISDNNLGGGITATNVSLCVHLTSLNLSSNYFVGELPELTNTFPNLTTLDVSSNNFTGEIPSSFGRSFPKLRVLSLQNCLFNGSFPQFLSNLTELTQLHPGMNPYKPTQLPLDIGRLTKLQTLDFKYSNLIGTIPDSIGNLVYVQTFDLSNNQLIGQLPESIGNLSAAVLIEIYNNNLSGELPDTFSNLTFLRFFDASQNNFSGLIPESLTGLPLSSLNLNDNLLQGEVPTNLASNPNLFQLKLFNNRLTGSLPADLGKNSGLEDFDVSGNFLEGPLPESLCYQKKLQRMLFFDNRFSGPIPESYGECSSLVYVRLQNNNLSGDVPEKFWGFSGYQFIELSGNHLEGSIPPSIGNAAGGLTQVLISGNKFSGDLPEEFCDLKELTIVDISGNGFSGELPNCIVKLSNLQRLDAQENDFAGDIPGSVSQWTQLTELNLSHNRLTGGISAQLGSLPVLTYLDLSGNLLSGKIPTELTKLKLNKFNLSYNRLEGKVPSGFDNEFFYASLVGNPGLCSPGVKVLGTCTRGKPGSLYLVVVLAVLAFVLIVSFVWVFIKSKGFAGFGRRSRRSWEITTFQRVGFGEEDILLGLVEENLIGTGGSGLVYRVVLKDGKSVAVKRLWEVHTKPELEQVFQSEVETLGRVRHGNIVKLLFSCIDEELKLLVYEYMENGSLGDVLHADKGGLELDWSRRFTIALGTAQGIAYLHHDCVPAIVHRDIKSNNVLLDNEYRPKIADFGLAKILQKDYSQQSHLVMSRVAGSYGYIAPEYAYTLKVTEKSDVYSFGVLLFELITGKRPNDSCFGENRDVVKWVNEIVTSHSKRVEDGEIINLDEIVDPRMDLSTCDYEEIVKVLEVGILCTSTLAINRPSMRKVVEILNHSMTSPR